MALQLLPLLLRKTVSHYGKKYVKSLKDKPRFKAYNIDPFTKKAYKTFHKPIISKTEASFIGGAAVGIGTHELGNYWLDISGKHKKSLMKENLKNHQKRTEFEKEMRRIHKKYGIQANYPKG